MAYATLQNIQTKVRRLTRSPSEAQLTTAQLNDYINNFILYDFPENLRLFKLRTVLTFYTQPNIDVYGTTTNVNDPLYNFQNNYVTIHPTVYMAGIQCFFTQWRDVFYGYYPQFNNVAQSGLFGNGTTGTFTGTLAAVPVLQNNVIFSCLDQSGQAMILVDYPVINTDGSVSNTTGALGLPQPTQNINGLPIPIPTLPSPYGQINYITGAYTLNFPSNTANLAPIEVTTIPYQAGKPVCMLYYNNQFTIRPVPDQVYAIQLEADLRPTALMNTTDIPQLEQWWQYIAYGASVKIFQDRMDLESVNLIMPEFMKQETLVLRTTLATQANERTVTIYTQGKVWGAGGFFNGGWPY